MDKYLNDETVWGCGSSVWLWPFTSNLASAQWKAIGQKPPHSSQSLLLYAEVWLGQWLMTVSVQKQRAAQVLSRPPAPRSRFEGNGKGCKQAAHHRLLTEHGERKRGAEQGKKREGEIDQKERWEAEIPRTFYYVPTAYNKLTGMNVYSTYKCIANFIITCRFLYKEMHFNLHIYNLCRSICCACIGYTKQPPTTCR